MAEGHKEILAALASSESEVIREGAYLAGKERLEEAIPLLAGHIQSPDIGVQEAVERALRKIGGPKVVKEAIPLLRSDDAPVRNIAMELLREVGVTDMDALCSLLHDKDADIRIFASDILGSTGSALAISPLCAALLRDPEVNVRYQAAVSLGNLAFPEAAESLNKALEDDEWVRFSVVEALTKIRAESSVGALIKALDASSDLVASTIVDALGEMGNLKAVPLLMRRLDSTSGPLRNKIAAAVIKILGSRSVKLLGEKERGKLHEYMLAAMHDDDVEVQDAVVRGLSATKGPGATEAIFTLALTLEPDRDHERLLFLVEALGKIGFNADVERIMREKGELATLIGVEVISRSPSRESVTFLQNIFWDQSRDLQRAIIIELAAQCLPEDQDFFVDVLSRHSDGNVLKAALLFLGRKGEASEVSEKVAALLDHPYDDVKEAALDACIALHDDIIVGHFLSMAASGDALHRMMAVHALGSIDLDAYEHIVANALKDEEPQVRRVALEALGKACPLPPSRLALIEKLAHDPDSEVRLTVITVLGNCDESRLDACLLGGVSDADAWVRVRCIESLGRRRTVEAVPYLVSLLGEENQLIAIKAIEALGSIGGEVAFRALLALIDHENPDIQHAAEEAVERIHTGEGA